MYIFLNKIVTFINIYNSICAYTCIGELMEDVASYIEELSDKLGSMDLPKGNDAPMVSVIVPAYNTADYIETCLFSIIEQTYKNIEIIIINDGSTDNTKSIISVFAQYDSRIKIINQKNQGVGNAKNNGLKIAQGKYIMFVDSDDYIDKKLIQECLRKASTAEIVIWGAFSVKNNKIKQGIYSINKIPAKFKNKVLQFSEFKPHIFKFLTVAWGKLYNAEMLKKNNVKFQNSEVGEDQLFFVHSMLSCKSIFVINENFYYYRRSRVGSLTSNSKKTTTAPIENFYAIEKIVNDKDFMPQIINRYFSKALCWYGKCAQTYKPEYFIKLNELVEYIKAKYNNGWWQLVNINRKDNYLTLKLKIYLAKSIKR